MFALARWVSLARHQDAREAEQFPQKAVAFLRAGDHPQKIFVYYDWGGYAIWKLYPEYRVFVDGRADLYGDDLLRQFQDRTAAPDRLAGTFLTSWKVDAVLMPPSCALAQALLLDPKWHAAFSDSKAIILLRDAPRRENAAVSRDPSQRLGLRQVKKCFPEPPESAKLGRNTGNWFQRLAPDWELHGVKLEGV